MILQNFPNLDSNILHFCCACISFLEFRTRIVEIYSRKCRLGKFQGIRQKSNPLISRCVSQLNLKHYIISSFVQNQVNANTCDWLRILERMFKKYYSFDKFKYYIRNRTDSKICRFLFPNNIFLSQFYFLLIILYHLQRPNQAILRLKELIFQFFDLLIQNCKKVDKCKASYISKNSIFWSKF